MAMSDDWSFVRWIRESRHFTRPMPWWKFYPKAVRNWFWFNRQQKIDRLRMADRDHA
jgi:hypothetical protein